MSYLSHLQCSTSGTRFAADQPHNNTCPDGGILEARYDLDRLRTEVDRDALGRGPSSLWRYAPLLPAARPHAAATLGEGWTPLLPVPALGRDMGCSNLWVKDEGRNPSGTFKDRGAAVAATRMVELGIDTMIHNSSGNAAAAWALYAARAGIRCVNLLPDDVLPASLLQSSMAGADTYVVDGPWLESGAMVRAAADRHGWFNGGTLKEPYRLEGKKTMGFEVCEQLGWKLPDVLVYPTGGALGAIAMYKAFRELRELGWIDAHHLPRLIVTQYEGCAPIVRAFEEGKDRAEPWRDLDVLPGGLKSTTPPGDRAVLSILRETGGTALAVSTEDSLTAVARMTRAEGIFPCPESATTLVGLDEALKRGVVDRGDTIVLMITGSGLRSIPVMPALDAPRLRAGEMVPES